MNRNQIIKTLSWFYSLELSQVDLYTAQSKQVNDRYLKNVLERVSVIEQQHVDKIADMIKEFGGKPTVIGDVIAPLTGKIAGKIIGWADVVNMLKVNISLEKRAMADYKDFILRSGSNSDLFDLLWSNLIDEDLHAAWFTNKVKELEKFDNG